MTIEDLFKQIAKDTLAIDSLEETWSSKDFHEVAVWQVKKALSEAYQAGALDKAKEITDLANKPTKADAYFAKAKEISKEVDGWYKWKKSF